MWGFLLLLLVSRSKEDGLQPGEVSWCGPQDLKVSRSAQTVLVTWEDDASCSALREPVLYRITVLVEHREAHSEEVSVAPGDIGSTHSWSWTSPLPLECASHTFRLTSRIHNRTSQLEQEATLHGESGSDGTRVFPQDAVLEAGSLATFCCIVPHGEQFDRLTVDGSTGRNTSTFRISEQRFALTLQLQAVSDRCVEVLCETKELTGGPTGGPYGSCVLIGYPPHVGDLQCETRDLESVECFWQEKRETLVELWSRTIYQLDGSPCDSKTSCSKKIRVEGGEKNFTLTAQNQLGKVEIHQTADLTRRVRMLAPHGLSAGEVEARKARLDWSWTLQQYRKLNLTCQIIASHSGGNFSQTEHGVGLNAAVLSDLRPNWEYEVKVRCRTAQRSWKWGDWSQSVSFRTEGDVPDAPDVWMKKEKNRTVIVWKRLLPVQSHGEITGYDVTWARAGRSDRLHNATVPPSIHRHALPLNAGEEHVVTVTARNKRGSSPPSTISVAAVGPDESTLTPSWISGINGTLDLSWAARPAASCGYVVDWVPAASDGPVDWLRLPPSQTSVRITDGLDAGRRYSLSVYACTPTSPLLLEKREGYAAETEIKPNLFQSLTYKQQGSDVEISWDPVPLREQPAFIRGYVLFYQEEGGELCNLTTDDPEATRLILENPRSSSYVFTAAARTAVGVCGHTTVSATLNFQADSFIKIIFTSLVAVFIILLLITVLCYRHWASIKEKVYPPIPKPDVGDWFSKPDTDVHPCRYVDPRRYAEEPVHVAELLYKPGEPMNNNQEDRAPVSARTPPGYRNHPARSAFPNLTYSLPMPGGDRTAGPEPRGGYKPHSVAEMFRQNQADQNPVPVVSEYMMAPQR